MLGDEDQNLPGDDFTRAQQTAGETQRTEQKCETQAIVRPSTSRDDGEIGGAEGVVSDQVGLCRRQREQRLELASVMTPRRGIGIPHSKRDDV